jgi:hypothetical protein
MHLYDKQQSDQQLPTRDQVHIFVKLENAKHAFFSGGRVYFLAGAYALFCVWSGLAEHNLKVDCRSAVKRFALLAAVNSVSS